MNKGVLYSGSALCSDLIAKNRDINGLLYFTAWNVSPTYRVDDDNADDPISGFIGVGAWNPAGILFKNTILDQIQITTPLPIPCHLLGL